MARIIISILGAQTIPNILFIKEFDRSKNTKHVFISSKEMNELQVAETIAAVCNLKPNQVQVITLDNKSVLKINDVLQRASFAETDEYVVNITGGNKLMSQMAFAFFAKMPKAAIYYLPINEPAIQKLHPQVAEVPLSVTLNLEEYFLAHNFLIHSIGTRTNFGFSPAYLFRDVIKNDGPANVPLITRALTQEYNNPDKMYLMGAWFEEWLYDYFKISLQLKTDEIAYNIKLKHLRSTSRTESDNEVDVAFVYNQKIYLLECKVYSSSAPVKGEKITIPMYKNAAVSKNFGLQAKNFVAILAPMGNGQQRIKDLENQNISKVFTWDDFVNPQNIIDHIKLS